MQPGELKELLPLISLCVAIIALAVSLWTRVEAFLALRRQRRIDLVRRVGDALVAVQHAKNDQAQFADKLEAFIADQSDTQHEIVITTFRQSLEKAESDYLSLSSIAEAFEGLVIQAERNGRFSLDQSVVEAKIARFTQIRALAQYNASYIVSDLPALVSNYSLKRINQSIHD